MTAADEFRVEPDPRMAQLVGGIDEAGRPLPMSPGRLRQSVASWPITPGTPPGVAGLLQTSRSLFVQSYFVYEFLTLAVLVSLQAVETALNVRLDAPRLSFEKLIVRAGREGLLNEEAKDGLHAGRGLRNHFSHPSEQTAWSYGMTAPIVRRSHELVSELFPTTD
ncbi:hypothetical protein [Nocardioides sp. W7]|uniref:hypothetical protein n=1 Tax=Nocardioides sp. W7 TaxID=2931390 RepID=UPI001FD44B87|nr:hypothetical protein [Nocardioides sp. W7]